MANILEINRPANKITLGTTDTTINVASHTASLLLSLDASKDLESVTDLTAWIAGTANQIIVTDDTDGTVTLSTPQDIHTGASPTFAGLTINQTADDQAITWNGYDDQSGENATLAIDGAGRLKITGTKPFIFGIDAVLLNNIKLKIGTDFDYVIEYQSGSTQFAFWSTDVDGGGTDGNIFTVQDGTDDIAFMGNLTIADNEWIGLGAAKGRIVFDDLAEDTLTFKNSRVRLELDNSSIATIYRPKNTLTGIQLDFSAQNDASEETVYGRIEAKNTTRTDGAEDGELVFYTTLDGAVAEACRINDKGNFTAEGTLYLKEQAAADGDTAAYGQLWVKNTTPCGLWFTDDIGNDRIIVDASHYITSAGVQHLGDGTNEVQFAADGTQTMAGTARVKKILILPVAASAVAGANIPSANQIGNYAGLEYALNDLSYFSFEVPYDCDVSEDITFDVHWFIDEANDDPGGANEEQIQWQISWTAVKEDGTEAVDGATEDEVSGDIAIPSTAKYMVSTSVGQINAAQVDADDIVGIKLTRIAVTKDDPAGDPTALSLEIEYTCNKLGEDIS